MLLLAALAWADPGPSLFDGCVEQTHGFATETRMFACTYLSAEVGDVRGGDTDRYHELALVKTRASHPDASGWDAGPAHERHGGRNYLVSRALDAPGGLAILVATSRDPDGKRFTCRNAGSDWAACERALDAVALGTWPAPEPPSQRVPPS